MFNYLKYFIIAMVIVKIAGAADVVCEKSRGWDRPVNDKAKAIAAYCKVKTCNGQCFADVVKTKKLTMTPLTRKASQSKEDFLKNLDKIK